jgi:glyoxylase-like metal-dependent hydrolase (beta-lactamase superfamily II)
MSSISVGPTSYVSSRQVGDATVTAINEGTVLWAPELTAPEAEWRAAIPEADEQGRVSADHHAFHIRLGDASILVDAGLDDPGSAWSEQWLADWPGARRTPGLTAGLASIGVRPEDITHIIITHAHYDHVQGLHRFQNGRPVPRFSHARILLGRGEWASQPLEEADETDFSVRSALADSGLLELVDGDREVVPRLWMLHAPGESPGHSIVRLTSAGETFYALGDLFHHACEVAHPEWAVPWAEPVTMRSTRDRFMAEAAEAGALVAFAHEPFPPWGRIVRVNGVYRWDRG